MAISAARVTRFGIGGGIWQPAGDFSTKEEGVPVVEVEEAKGGGKKRRKGKYPRRVMIDGVLHWVRNAEEERQLLQAFADRARDAAKVAAALDDKPLAETIKTRSVRIEKRIKTVDTREADWRQHLLDEDEEILLLFQ